MSGIERLLREHVSAVPPYVTARSRYQGGVLLDANENPLGPPAPDLPSDLNRYPDPASGELRSALATWLDVAEDRLWFGNGSDEGIDLLIRLFVDPGSPVIVTAPSYAVYAQRAAAHGAAARSVRLDERYDLDVDATLQASKGASLIFLCSPNNPTGNLLSSGRVLELLARVRCVVALDEAYVEFAGADARAESLAMLAGRSEAAPGSERLVVLRTFSKAWGLAGARAGYAIGAASLVEAMSRVGLPYPLSSLSARAACEAIERAPRMERARNRLISERARLADRLRDLGIGSLPSDANFLLFFVDDPNAVHGRLADEHGIIIRNRSRMPGLGGALRVSVGTPEENDRFLAALQEVVS